jgi:hypothetical protein
MRIGTGAVMLVALTLGACANKSDTAQTTPPAQGGQTAAAPAPAAAAAPASAPAAGRQAPAALTVADHAATMKTIAQNVQAAGKAL